MPHIPVISSILSATHLGVVVQDIYGLNNSTTCSLLKSGINHSYLISDFPNKFVFRLYTINWRTRLEIEEEIRLLNLLRDSHIQVSYPVKDANGSYIQEIQAPEGMRYGVMFSFAEGEKLLNFPANIHFKVGETMARIHQITHNLHLKREVYTPQVILQNSLERLLKYLPGDTEEMQWMTSTQQAILNELATVKTDDLRQGVVHLDIWFDNLNITNEGEVTLFDFDFCGNGWLCYDIAYYIMQLHSTEKVAAERDGKIKSFFAGYKSVTPISQEERRFLPVLGVSLYFFYLGIQCSRFEDWSNVFLNETYLKRFINLLVKKYYDENVVAKTDVNQA